jgi:hypothetical protein
MTPLALPSPPGDCVVIQGRQGKTGQTAGFQNFRMRTFNVRGNGRRHKKVHSFMTLVLLSFTVKRLRLKAFSPACLSRFSEILALI